MAVKDEIRAQRQKLKGQGFKAHWEYFWEYYKIHTIVAIIVLIFVVVTIRDIASKKPYALYTIMVNNMGMETQDILQDGFMKYAEIDTSSQAVLVDTASNYLSSSMDNTVIATSEKIMALLAAHELDVMVANDSVLYHYATQDTFMDMRDYYSADELKELEDKGMILYVDRAYMDYLASDDYTNYLTSGKYDENNKYAVIAAEYDETFEYDIPDKSEMSDPIPIGIILKDSSALKECDAYPDKTAAAAIAINTDRLETAKKFLDYLQK